MTDNKTGDNIQQNAEKILNVGKADVVNFYEVENKGSKKIFNKIFISELISQLKKEPENKFPENLSFVEQDNWTNNSVFLKDALTYYAKNFIWVIGDEIRRLFYIGNFNKYNLESDKISDYIIRSIRIYRSSLQLMNYVFISKLWDEKLSHKNIDSDSPHIRNFFQTNVLLSLKDLRLLFRELISTFKNNNLEFPLDNEHVSN